MKKIISIIVWLAIATQISYGQNPKSGIGLSIGVISGPGFTFKHFFNEKNAVKILATPPVLWEGQIVFSNIGISYYRVLSDRNNKKVSIWTSASYMLIYPENVFIVPGCGLEDERMLDNKQAIALSFGWSGFLTTGQHGIFHYQTFPTLQVEYTFYFK